MTSSYTYSVVDIETVMRRFTADVVMMATSSNAITEAKARDYAHDVEALAKAGYLDMVDLTLYNLGVEVKAAQYKVNTSSGELAMNRPGGVMWPRVSFPEFRIVLYHTDAYDAAAQQAMRSKLRVSWSATNADTSHSSLKQSQGRDYASNGWGLQRTDFSS